MPLEFEVLSPADFEESPLEEFSLEALLPEESLSEAWLSEESLSEELLPETLSSEELLPLELLLSGRLLLRRLSKISYPVNKAAPVVTLRGV